MNDLWQAAGIALALGLLVGAERERSKPGGSGVRTFALVALLGNVATLLPITYGAVVLGGIVLLVAVSYAGTWKTDPGMTSEVALVTTAGLGALTGRYPAIAVGAAVAMVVVLSSKETLHRFLRETVTERERADAIKFFVAAFIVLPLLPRDSFGPADVLSPQRIWLLVVLITAIGWIGYAATRALGANRGQLIAGLAGGFVSATATIGLLGAKARRAEVSLRAALAGALMASVATLVEMAVLTTAVEPTVAVRLYPGLAAGLVVLLFEGWWLGRKHGDAPGQHHETPGRPFALTPALILAAVISLVVVAGAWMQGRYGAAGAQVVAATGGLADAHATAVALAGLAHVHQLTATSAALAILLALATNTLSKIVAAGIGGGRLYAVQTFLLHLTPAAAVAAGVLVPQLL
jgi:uncharacterized membrane protein (DUF4010 family)